MLDFFSVINKLFPNILNNKMLLKKKKEDVKINCGSILVMWVVMCIDLR